MENTTRFFALAAALTIACGDRSATPSVTTVSTATAVPAPVTPLPAAPSSAAPAPAAVAEPPPAPKAALEPALPRNLAGRRFAIDYETIKMAMTHFIDFCPGDLAIDNKNDQPRRGKYEQHEGLVTVSAKGERSQLLLSDDGTSLTDKEAPPLPRRRRVFKESGPAACP